MINYTSNYELFGRHLEWAGVKIKDLPASDLSVGTNCVTPGLAWKLVLNPLEWIQLAPST